MHPWNISVSEAKEIQLRLSKKIICKGRPGKIKFIAGVDVAYASEVSYAFCAIVIFKYPALELLNITCSNDIINFPYIPGLLSFREGPVILKTFKKLQIRPDIVIFDGHGIAHPGKLGLASHIGLLLNIPAIGCAKSVLYGKYEEPGLKKGSESLLYDDFNMPIGIVLRSRQNVKPVFISPGHLMGIHESSGIIMKCLTRYRIPEPLRAADIQVSKYKKKVLTDFDSKLNLTY
jgi:deoxyribonuclease V